jgi:acyl-CoA reductase-like NAD-dependent aldehyde dehydrogenase
LWFPVTDTDELVKRANATMFGLGSGVWTKDVSKAHKLAAAIRAGSDGSIATRRWIRLFRSEVIE